MSTFHIFILDGGGAAVRGSLEMNTKYGLIRYDYYFLHQYIRAQISSEKHCCFVFIAMDTVLHQGKHIHVDIPHTPIYTPYITEE